MNEPTDPTRPTTPKLLATGSWLGALLTVSGALVVAFSDFLFVGTLLLLPGALLVMRCAHAANFVMHRFEASEKYDREKDRLFFAVFGPAMVFGILMFVVAVIALLLQIAVLL